MQNKYTENECHCYVMSVKMKSIWIAMNLDTRKRGGRGVGSNMMADDCAQGSLQARPNESLNVCE